MVNNASYELIKVHDVEYDYSNWWVWGIMFNVLLADSHQIPKTMWNKCGFLSTCNTTHLLFITQCMCMFKWKWENEHEYVPVCFKLKFILMMLN